MANKQPKTARAVQPNKGVEVAYRKALDKLIAEMSNSTEYWLEAAYKANPPRIAQDAMPSAELSKKVKSLADRWTERFNEMSVSIAKRFTEQGVKHTDSSFKQALKDAGWTIEFKMTPIMRDATNAVIQENVSLIRSIPSQYFTEVEGIVMRGFTQGRDLQAISKDLQERYGVTKRRAALIARDQSNKLTATVTQARRVDLGLYEAIWVHSGAGREPRPSHLKAGKDKLKFDVREGAYLDGKLVLPGQEINCRCSSKTVLPF